jgi:hypothetical protein
LVLLLPLIPPGAHHTKMTDPSSSFFRGECEKMIMPVMRRPDGELKSLFRMQGLRYDSCGVRS